MSPFPSLPSLSALTLVHPLFSPQSVALFNFRAGQLMSKWTTHEKEVTKVLYGAQCRAHFSASRDKVVNMWQTGITDPVLSFVGHDMVVTGLAINQGITNSVLLLKVLNNLTSKCKI